MKSGKLKGKQVGKVYMISQEAVGDFLKDHKNKKKKINQTRLDF